MTLIPRRLFATVFLLLAAMLAYPLDSLAQSTRYGLSNAEVVDQYGNMRRFNQDILGDRIVIVGFTWLGGHSVCPITDQIMQATQEEMEGRSQRYGWYPYPQSAVGYPSEDGGKGTGIRSWPRMALVERRPP